MTNKWIENFEKTKQLTKYVDIKDATKSDYEYLGFRCGLEVHQQLLTEKKLFCRCPAGMYHDFNDYDAEIIRHMRPTLSELGEYDGTALMEFKTKKEIIYRINKKTACTYEMDDTPPFPINKDALAKALKIAHLLRMNIVGELHITRKQYLDGSIPTGFQRTTILGIEGEIFLKNKKIKLIQFSCEEDSCREVSDFEHKRVYFTDRLGMPLIETVTYPEMLTPWEAEEACQNIRFIARSTGLVRTGIGAGRQDVNVSVTGGTRVEIKGVAHIKWIPKLTHNEGFRQKSLLLIKNELNIRFKDSSIWEMTHKELSLNELFTIKLNLCSTDDKQATNFLNIESSKENYFNMYSIPYINEEYKIIAINLPNLKGILSFFTQPYRTFADEISDRIKVIGCVEKPNMIHNEFVPFDTASNYKERLSFKISNDLGRHPLLKEMYSKIDWIELQRILSASENDAQIIFWAKNEDIPTVLDTISERIKLAFSCVPNETRKSRPDGTNIFERVLPGPDRMYPDTDSKPVSLTSEFIDLTKENLPETLSYKYEQLKKWNVPEDTFIFILRHDLTPLIEQIVNEFNFSYSSVSILFGQFIKNLFGKDIVGTSKSDNKQFIFKMTYDLCKYMKDEELDFYIIHKLLKKAVNSSNLNYDDLLAKIGFKRYSKDELFEKADNLMNEYDTLPKKSSNLGAKQRWVMGKIKNFALGNINLTTIAEYLKLKGK